VLLHVDADEIGDADRAMKENSTHTAIRIREAAWMG